MVVVVVVGGGDAVRVGQDTLGLAPVSGDVFSDSG